MSWPLLYTIDCFLQMSEVTFIKVVQMMAGNSRPKEISHFNCFKHICVADHGNTVTDGFLSPSTIHIFRIFDIKNSILHELENEPQ